MVTSNVLIHQRYRVVKLLKIGGMSEVYEAIDERINSRVALKRLRLPHPTPQSLQAFKREATLLANLRHPSLPRVTDHFHEQQTPWVVMEFIPGPDLDEMLQQRGHAFPIPMVMDWALQLCDVLNTLHTKTPPILRNSAI